MVGRGRAGRRGKQLISDDEPERRQDPACGAVPIYRPRRTRQRQGRTGSRPTAPAVSTTGADPLGSGSRSEWQSWGEGASRQAARSLSRAAHRRQARVPQRVVRTPTSQQTPSSLRARNHPSFSEPLGRPRSRCKLLRALRNPGPAECIACGATVALPLVTCMDDPQLIAPISRDTGEPPRSGMGGPRRARGGYPWLADARVGMVAVLDAVGSRRSTTTTVATIASLPLVSELHDRPRLRRKAAGVSQNERSPMGTPRPFATMPYRDGFLRTSSSLFRLSRHVGTDKHVCNGAWTRHAPPTLQGRSPRWLGR
jgi:hypothetical protein